MIRLVLVVSSILSQWVFRSIGMYGCMGSVLRIFLHVYTCCSHQSFIISVANTSNRHEQCLSIWWFVYMQQPPGFVSKDSTLACKLTKAIYGLKQASRSWFHKLSQTLFSFGFTPTKSDPSLFTMFSNSFIVFILIYVDDTIITTPEVFSCHCISH